MRALHLVAVCITTCLLAGTADAADCDATAVVASITSNLHGPAGKMVVATGTLTFGSTVKNVKFAHYVGPDGTEAFQGEDRGDDNEFLKKIRLIRTGSTQATTLVFLPTMQQGRKMRFTPTQPLFGTGEYHHYLLLPTRALESDYAFRCEAATDGAVVLSGKRNPSATLAPYPAVRLTTRQRGDVWVVEEAECEGTGEFPSFKQTFGRYAEVSPGSWAPAEIRLNGVALQLEWRLEPVVDWIASDRIAFMREEDLP